uniref:THAP domain containing 6 n=2 Tax=Sus scrofa TaxID=9823 RepID=A0A8D1SJ82_PIG
MPVACLIESLTMKTESYESVNHGGLLNIPVPKSNNKLKNQFPTDEKVKRKWVLAMKRLDVNAAGMWEPKKGDVLCSRHFKKTDFDRTTPNIKLKPGVIPSIFDSPSHLQVC